MRKTPIFAFVLLTLAGTAGTNGLGVAREALRDGLWDVARTHAMRAGGDEAKLIVLESHAREDDWKGLLAALDKMGNPTGEGFAYYRALALFNGGSAEAASNVLAGVMFAEADFARPATRLKAEIALAAGGSEAAIAILGENGGDDVETMLTVASIRAATGRRDDAQRLWRGVLSRTNVAERALATAAAGVGDVKLLRKFSTSAKHSAVRRFASLRLGMLLVRSKDAFDEGMRLICATVREKPDAEGAREAFYALAEARVARGEYAEAERVYSDALEIWPEASRDASLHEGRGWVLTRLGRASDALLEFRQAEELYVDTERKSVVAAKTADALAVAGRAKEASEAYQRVLRAYPGTKAAARVADVIQFRETEATGRELYRAFKFDKASRVFSDLARKDPSCRERMQYYCVLCAYGAGDDETAEATARELSEDAKDTAVRADAMLWLAKFSFNRGRWQVARRLFADFAVVSPRSPDAAGALVWAARAALADNDFQGAIATVVRLVSSYPNSPMRAAGMLVQGEALIELARFDEAVLVLDRASLVADASDDVRLNARVMRADALFAMGADNPSRYRAALDAYNAIRAGEELPPGLALSVSFKIARTLEKLKRVDEAADAYYTQVVLAYRTGRIAGTQYDDEARATFARAAFRLADVYESRGRIRQAVHVLELVRTSDVPASGEAASRIEKMSQKGMFP